MTKLSYHFHGGEKTGRRMRENRSGRWEPLIHRGGRCSDNLVSSVKACADWIPFEMLLFEALNSQGQRVATGDARKKKGKGTVVLGNTPCCLAVKELQRVRPSLCLACPSVYLCQGRDIWLEHFPEGIDLFFWARKNMNELFEACSKDTNNIPGNTSKSHNIHIIWSIRGK